MELTQEQKLYQKGAYIGSGPIMYNPFGKLGLGSGGPGPIDIIIPNSTF